MTTTNKISGAKQFGEEDIREVNKENRGRGPPLRKKLNSFWKSDLKKKRKKVVSVKELCPISVDISGKCDIIDIVR